jgi:hypothetical protein
MDEPVSTERLNEDLQEFVTENTQKILNYAAFIVPVTFPHGQINGMINVLMSGIASLLFRYVEPESYAEVLKGLAESTYRNIEANLKRAQAAEEHNE